MTLRVMLVGDTHGNAGAVHRKARVAQSMGVERMIILGDFRIVARS
jgi:predicted phosphodiesterase